jgi:FMN phosphatase YigB (HAD superfamily)
LLTGGRAVGVIKETSSGQAGKRERQYAFTKDSDYTQMTKDWIASFHPGAEINIEKARWRSVLNNILKEDYTEEIFDALWGSMGHGDRWKTKPKLRRTLQGLKDIGFRLVVVSNWDNRLHRILSDLNIDDYFDHVFISTELGGENHRKTFSTVRCRN